MVERHADVVVIGGGAMGLATAWWLAPRARVVVLERFEPGHHRGASHGDERIFRYLYSDPTYVEMALAADEGWQRLEHDAGRQLLHRVGSVQHGSSTAELDAMMQAADQLGVAVERLSATDAATRWPAMQFAGDVVVQPTAGWLRAADTLESLAALVTDAGAELRFGTPVAAVEPGARGVEVRVGRDSYWADVVVVTGGAWTTDLLPDLALPPLLTTEEHVFFFEFTAAAAMEIPSFLHEHDCIRYGLVGPTGRVKIGEHHTGDVTTGDDRTFAADPVRTARMERYVATWCPGLVPRAVGTTTCLYTSTPTYDFVLDRVGRVVVGAGFSGHGFKFVPEIGRRLAAMVTDDAGTHPQFAVGSQRADANPLTES